MNEPANVSRPASGRTSRRLLILGLAGLVCGGVLLLPPVKRRLLTVIDRLRSEKVVEKVVTRTEIVEKAVEKLVEVPAPPEPLPSGPVLVSRKDVSTLVGGLKLKSTLNAEQGGFASAERIADDSYAVEFTFRVKVPKPAAGFEEFKAINPALPDLFPSFNDLLTTAKVSGFYHHLYALKQKNIQTNILRLDRVLTRHNFFDLESALELENAETKQKALLLQGEMDVVSDGSDGDRMESFDDYLFKSQHFQPTTSYAWDKVTTKPNPLIARLEEELRGIEEKLKGNSLSTAEKTSQKERAAAIPRIIADLKRKSFLIAQEDPFIVIPLSFRTYRGSNAYAPGIGDYAVVICGDKLMPAIVGDYGPSDKCGEASLRIAREIDPKAGPYNRPVSDLKVTYLIFPDSAAKKPSAPDYAAWHKQCSDLFTRIGGNSARMLTWKDRLKKDPPPASEATPAPGTPAAGDKPASPP